MIKKKTRLFVGAQAAAGAGGLWNGQKADELDGRQVLRAIIK